MTFDINKIIWASLINFVKKMSGMKLRRQREAAGEKCTLPLQRIHNGVGKFAWQPACCHGNDMTAHWVGDDAGCQGRLLCSLGKQRISARGYFGGFVLPSNLSLFSHNSSVINRNMSAMREWKRRRRKKCAMQRVAGVRYGNKYVENLYCAD